jgi:regulator of protease activity HflC (stomatin/prohibitin superfamily)
MKKEKGGGEIFAVLFLSILAVFITGGLLAGCPIYNVYVKTKSGEAQLKEATWNRQIKVEEAKAEKESAVLKAEAEVERAKGVARANEIIGGSLKGNSEYLRYLWINGLQTNNMQVVYVPTEAGLPILEAGKRNAAGP